MSPPPVTLLRDLDSTLRNTMKEILHLPPSTTNSLLYCGKKDGGLGLPRLETVVTTTTLKTGASLLNSSDPVTKALVNNSDLQGRLKKLANAARLNWPPSADDLNNYKKSMKKAEIQHWESLTSQGKSAPAFKNTKISNEWLYNPDLLKPCRMITALKLRTNTGGNRTALNNAIPQPDLKCRKGCDQLETLGHILGQCTATKAERIHRHNEIRDLIAIEANKKKATITLEPTLPNPNGGKLKPDLVLKHQERVYVVDVTVRHEDNNYLQQGHQEKIDKYNILIPPLCQQMGAADGQVLPVVVGTRGAIPPSTILSLSKIGITSRHTLRTISMIALRNSIETYHRFLDYDAPQRRLRR